MNASSKSATATSKSVVPAAEDGEHLGWHGLNFGYSQRADDSASGRMDGREGRRTAKRADGWSSGRTG